MSRDGNRAYLLFTDNIPKVFEHSYILDMKKTLKLNRKYHCMSRESAPGRVYKINTDN